MKRFLPLLLLLINLLPAQAVKKIEANPINIAFLLAQETDSAKMASICDYYGYQPYTDSSNSNKSASAGLSSGKTNTYRHPNGSIIRYTFRDATPSQPYPKVEVKSKKSSKEIEYILTDLRFEKQANGYKRKLGQYARSVTDCKYGHGGFLVFHQTIIPRE